MAKMILKRVLVNLSDPIPVYDLTSDAHHNFTIENGCVVHNSKDMSDAVAGSIWTAYQNYTKYAGIMTDLTNAVTKSKMNDGWNPTIE